MIDNFKVEDTENFYSIPSRTEPFNLFDSDFYPRYNQAGKYIYHSSTFGNLVAKITGGRFTLENSLHKLALGNNFSDFTHSEIVMAIEQIEKKYNISSDNLEFRRVEIAVNIEYDKNLHDLFKQYGMKEFDRMRSGKTVYGKKHFSSEYNVKGYDKSMETKLHREFDVLGNLIIAPKNTERFEIEYKKMRPLNTILKTLTDLKNKATLNDLGLMIVKCFDKIEFSEEYNYSILTPRERELVFAGYHSEFWEVEKINKNTRKKKRSLFNRCVKKLDAELSNSTKNEIRNLMLEKINYLVSN